MDMHEPAISWQTIPTDILVLILKPLILKPRFSYLPLTCTHVCRHWRQAVSGTPSLWSFIDVARGASLTRLWLSNSANSPIDVRLWQRPDESTHPAHSTRQPVCSAVENVRQTVRRWRSLDVSFWCMPCLEGTIAWLASVRPTLELESLSIGPMGRYSVSLHPDDDRAEFVLERLGKVLTIQPRVLRLDSFPIFAKSGLYSSRLTTLEFIVGITTLPGVLHATWSAILRSSPNLVSLTVWDPVKSVPQRFVEPTCPEEVVSLPQLRHLSLNSIYLELCLMVARSPLPSLDTLRLDSSVQSTSVARYVEKVGAVAPGLRELAISHQIWVGHLVEPWAEAFDRLQSLEQLVLFEMSDDTVTEILQLNNLPRTLTEVRLERIYFRHAITWPPGAWFNTAPRLVISGYNEYVDILSEDGATRRICHGSMDKTKCKDLPVDMVLYDWETSLYTIREDLAMSRGFASGSRLYGEDSSDEPVDTDEASTSHDSGSEASFASGDLYIIKQRQKQFSKRTYRDPSDSWVSTSDSGGMTSDEDEA